MVRKTKWMQKKMDDVEKETVDHVEKKTDDNVKEKRL